MKGVVWQCDVADVTAEEVYGHYYRYYRRRTPQLDIRWVVLGSILVISMVQVSVLVDALLSAFSFLPSLPSPTLSLHPLLSFLHSPLPPFSLSSPPSSSHPSLSPLLTHFFLSLVHRLVALLSIGHFCCSPHAPVSFPS